MSTRSARPVIGALAMAACAAVAGCGASGIGSVPPSRYLVCQSLVGCAGQAPEHEPKSVYMSGDGSLYADHVTWAGWGTAIATGRGTAEANNCEPDCAQGTYSAHPVTITLTKPEPWHGDEVYTSAAYSIPSLHLRNTFTVGLPPEAQRSAAALAAPAAPGPVSTPDTERV